MQRKAARCVLQPCRTAPCHYTANDVGGVMHAILRRSFGGGDKKMGKSILAWHDALAGAAGVPATGVAESDHASSGSSHPACRIMSGTGFPAGPSAFVVLTGLVMLLALVPQVWAAAELSIAGGRDTTFAVDSQGTLRGWGRQMSAGSATPKKVVLPVAAAAVLAGGQQAYAIGRDGSLWAWGNNTLGQLGDGTTSNRASPVRVFDSGVRTLASNVNHTLLIKTDGSLWAWGNNYTGNLGVGVTGGTQLQPTQIDKGPFAAVAAGSGHSLAVMADGRLFAWGDNSRGQLGNGTTQDSNRPIYLGDGFVAVAAGYFHSLALRADGTLWAWGLNQVGQLGNGTTQSTATPVQIGQNIVAITAAGYNGAAIDEMGFMYVWGQWPIGGGNAVYLKPTIMGMNMVAVSTGLFHGQALSADGRLWSWGENRLGQLGDGGQLALSEGVAIGSGFVDVAAGESFSLALKSDGTLWAWGDDSQDQLGDGPPPLLTTASIVGQAYRSVAVGPTHKLAVKRDGTLMAWGMGEARLGLGSVGHQLSPRTVMTGVAAASAGAEHSLALKSDGTLWVWGDNSHGQLGLDQMVSWTPVQLASARYKSVAAGYRHTLAIQSDGSLWAWGSNEHGQLGDGSTTLRRAPVRIGQGYKDVAGGGAHSLALKDDGSLWAWGYNLNGQVGDGQTQDVLQPKKIGDGYTAIAAGQQHSLALKADGSLWAWGGNYMRQLGDGSSETRRLAPTKIGDDFIAIASGPAQNHAVAVKKDGTLLTWGSNDNGQLGDGTLASAPRPINVVNEAATANLDLLPEMVNDTGSRVLPYYLKARKSGIDLKTALSDPVAAGIKGNIYFTALLPADSPLLGATRSRAGGGMVAGALGRGGFKQTGGQVAAEPAYSGDLGASGEQPVYTTRSGEPDPLENSNAVICMGVATPEMSAKGQVIMRPIATGSAVQGVVQCPPVQTRATIERYRAQVSGPLEALTVRAQIEPQDDERGQRLNVYSWAVAPNGQQFMQTGPDRWEAMREPMQPAMSGVDVPMSGAIELRVTNSLDLRSLAGTLVHVGLGRSWDEAKHRAGQYYTVGQ